MNVDVIKNIQKVLGVEQDGIIGSITRRAIADKLINIAQKEIGIHETSPNHGDGIAKYWEACDYSDGYKDRAPYCAAFLSWCFKQSGIFSEKNRPKTAGAFAYEQWARGLGISVIKDPDYIKRGDVVIFRYSHIEICKQGSDYNGDFMTIGANTSPDNAGSQRDGGGVYQRNRNVGSVRSIIRI